MLNTATEFIGRICMSHYRTIQWPLSMSNRPACLISRLKDEKIGLPALDYTKLLAPWTASKSDI